MRFPALCESLMFQRGITALGVCALLTCSCFVKVPDLGTNADPYSGYLLYEPSAVGVGEPALEGGWGGTSFVAPQLNGSTAVIDSFLGHRVGFWNPSIYAFATGGSSPFTPLQASGTSNDNLYYTGNPGQVFNQGNGLGIPNLSRLAADFAG